MAGQNRASEYSQTAKEAQKQEESVRHSSLYQPHERHDDSKNHPAALPNPHRHAVVQ